MHVFACPICGSSALDAKNIELRHVNTVTKVTSSKNVVELECRDCGWFGTIEQAEDADNHLKSHL